MGEMDSYSEIQIFKKKKQLESFYSFLWLLWVLPSTQIKSKRV